MLHKPSQQALKEASTPFFLGSPVNNAGGREEDYPVSNVNGDKMTF